MGFHQEKIVDGDKTRTSTMNVPHNYILTVTLNSLIRETPDGCGDFIIPVVGGQDVPANLEVRLR